MAQIKTIQGIDTVSSSRLILNENFASINQQLSEFSQLLDGLEGSGGSSFNGVLTSNIIPNQNEVYDLGSETNRFRDLYLSNNTLYLGENSIRMANGNMLVNGNPLVTNNRLLEEAAERARLLGIETTARSQAISSVSERITSVSDANAAIAQSLTNLNTSFEAQIADAVGGETLARIAAVSDINQTLTSISNANEAIAETINNLDTSFITEIAAALGAETAERTEAISNINQTLTSISNANEAIAQSVTDLSASFVTEINEAVGGETLARTEAVSNINQTLTSLSNANQAIAESVTGLNAFFATEIADAVGEETAARTEAVSNINQTLTSLTNANEAIAQSVTDLSSSFITEIENAVEGEAATRTEAISSINQTLTTLNDANSANAESITTLQAQYIIENGDITGFSQSSALKNVIDSAIATANEATVNSTTELIAELGDQTAAVTEEMTASIDAITGKIAAQYTLEVDANGNVAGMKLGADENGSSIKFTADSFKVSTGGPNGVELTPFSIIDGQVAFNGSVSFSGGGTNGTNGTNGTSSYLHIAYADTSTGGGFTTTPTDNKSYIGQYVDSNQTASTNPSLYTWTLFKGRDGINGVDGLQGADGTDGINGVDGTSTYFHIAYADNASGSGFSQSGLNKTYIGTYVDSTQTDAAANSPLWNWQLVKGADGTDGENGIAGTNGADGKTTYLHIAYANNSTGDSGFSTTVSAGKTYIGQYTDFTLADSSNPALYKWTLIKGEKGDPGERGLQGLQGTNGTNGIQGPAGTNGVSTYFHIAYADNASGGGFSQSASGKLYIGTYVDTTSTDAASGSSLWKWQLVKGSDGSNGQNGTPGTNGTDGQTSYLHIAYANNSSGTSGFSTTDSNGKLYIGQYTDFTLADSSNPAVYSWTLIKGETGAQGATGPQGPAPDTSQFLTTTTTIDGGKITTGIIKNGNFAAGSPGWDTYSTTGFGINLDLGAINSKNFYIDPAGNAKFKGDIDSVNATIGGSPMTDVFNVEQSYDEVQNVFRPVLKMRGDVYIGESRFSNFSENLYSLGSSLSNFRNDYNDRFEAAIQTTLSHRYIKRNEILLETGDLVKLDENNELVKASTAKDPAIVGILWEEAIFSITQDDLEKPHHYRDSLGNQIPTEDRDQKSIWRVAALGDSFDFNSELKGIKVCNQNGPVLKGDLLCSSDIPGYAMKQPVEYAIIGFDNGVPQYEERQTITSFTLGKCMEDCTFNSEGKATGIYGYLYCG